MKNNKFNEVIINYISEAIAVNPEDIKNQLAAKIGTGLSRPVADALTAVSGAIEKTTETDKFQKDFNILSSEDSTDEEKAEAMLRLIDQKRLPNITKTEENSTEEEKEENLSTSSTSIKKPIQKTPLTSMSDNTYKAPI